VYNVQIFQQAKCITLVYPAQQGPKMFIRPGGPKMLCVSLAHTLVEQFVPNYYAGLRITNLINQKFNTVNIHKKELANFLSQI